MSLWHAPSNERHSYFLCGAYDFSRGQLPHFHDKDGRVRASSMENAILKSQMKKMAF
jgi:hypothetical protein